jgi:hypothetical protein
MKSKIDTGCRRFVVSVLTGLALTFAASAPAQLILNNNAVQTINFDQSVGWLADTWSYYPGSVFHATGTLDDRTANWAVPGDWGFQNTGGKQCFSSAAWAYRNANYNGGARSAFADSGSGAGSWEQIRFVNSVSHPELTSVAVQFDQDAWANRDLTLRIQNNTGATIENWNVGFDLSKYGNFQPGWAGNNTFSLLYSTDNTNFTASGISQVLGNGANATAVTSLGTQTAALNVTVPVGGYLYLRFNYDTGGGAGNGALLDNVTVQGLGAVVLATTTTTLGASPNPSTTSQSVVFTATVRTNGVTATAATGSVVFRDGATPISTNDVINGVATFSTADLTAGVHPMTAEYSGDSAYFPSTSTITNQIVNPTTTVLTSSENPSTNGDSVTFTATITPADNGGNLVTFYDGLIVLGTAYTDVPGVATLTTSALTPGVHHLSATFGGSVDLAPSTSAILNQSVISLACLWVSNNTALTITFDQSIGWDGDWLPASVLFANPTNLDNNSIPAYGSGEGIPATGKTGLSKDAWSYQKNNYVETQTTFGGSSFSWWGGSKFLNGGNDIAFSSTALQLGESGAWAPGNLTLKILNKTGSTVSYWTLGLDAWGLGSNDPSTTVKLQVSTDNSSFSDALILPVSGETNNYTSLGTHSASGVSATVANGGFLYVRYLYSVTASGNGFAMDNLTIQALDTVALIPPTVSGSGLNGGNYEVTFSGPSGQTYHVLSSTNVALPLASWTPVSSGTFAGSPVTYTNSSPNDAQRFYIITSP